ncbi:MAG: cobalamin B12-binding domain-containing protein [Pseudomonadota bacterium]
MTQDRTRDKGATRGLAIVSGRAHPDFTAIPHTADLDSTLLFDLWEAALSADRAACQQVLRRAITNGVSQITLADRYIPAVAHQLGEMWCADTLGFAEVTIGTARLQALLRELGPEWTADQMAPADAPLILLISPQNDQHTLGTVLVAGQLRRRGCSVRMVLDPARDDLARIMHQMSFNAVFISASQSESLEKLRRMIDFLRKCSDEPLPFALGGGVLEDKRQVASLVGVEVATNSIDEAIKKCGLTLPPTPGANCAPKV